MLKYFYNQLGFFGALGVSFLLFLLFVFWIAGIAGISLPYDGGSKKKNTWEILLAVLIPVYPIGWLVVDIINQRRLMRKKTDSSG